MLALKEENDRLILVFFTFYHKRNSNFCNWGANIFYKREAWATLKTRNFVGLLRYLSFKLDPLYDNGGMLFLLNPYEPRELQRVYMEHKSKSEKNSSEDLTQDDIADVVLEPLCE